MPTVEIKYTNTQDLQLLNAGSCCGVQELTQSNPSPLLLQQIRTNTPCMDYPEAWVLSEQFEIQIPSPQCLEVPLMSTAPP